MRTRVILPYDPEWRALRWAKKHCPSYITNQADVNRKIVYYFSDEQEAMLFTLRWA